MRGGIISQEEMLAIPAFEISDLNQIPSEPLVSVLVITYNHEAFLKDCLEGVLAQQCDFPIEVIIGEDKSTDGTLEICLDYQRRYPHLIRILSWDENVGANANFLRCWGRARGKYVAVCEGDDYWVDELKLTKQVTIMEESPDVILCGAKNRVEDVADPRSNGRIFGPKKNKRNYNLEDVINNYLFHTATYLCRRSSLEFTQHACSIVLLDYYLQFRSAIKGKIVCLSDIVSVYRHHDKGIYYGNSGLIHCQRLIDVYNKLLPSVDKYHGKCIKRKINIIKSFYCHQLIKYGQLNDAKSIYKTIILNIIQQNPLIAILLSGHILAPKLYNKLKRLLKNSFY